MFEVKTKYGKVVYFGTRKACWMYCEMYDRYGTWRIEKHVQKNKQMCELTEKENNRT